MRAAFNRRYDAEFPSSDRKLQQACADGDQDNDPGNVTDCLAGSAQGTIVRASELQVFNDE